MYARLWQLRIRPGKLEEFKSAVDSLLPPAHQQRGFLGALALRSSEKEAPHVTLIALWDSLDAIRASERNLLVAQAISRLVGCCEGFPQIEEREVLVWDFTSSAKPIPWSGRLI